MKPSTSTHNVLLISKLLDLHLSRAIAREHLKDRVMRKFIQLAEDVENDLKELDNDADELDRRRRDGKERAKAVVNTHHRLQDRIDEGIAALEKVADDAGVTRRNTRTAAELEAIERDEAINQARATMSPEAFAAWLKEKGWAPNLGEASGDTPGASFQKAAE